MKAFNYYTEMHKEGTEGHKEINSPPSPLHFPVRLRLAFRR